MDKLEILSPNREIDVSMRVKKITQEKRLRSQMKLTVSVLFLLACLILRTQGCWQALETPKCSVPSDPGLTGNVAFLTDYNLILDVTARNAVKSMNTTGMDVQFIAPLNYHVSIYYFFCMLQNQTSTVHNSFSSFRWKPFSITFNRLCCEPPKYVEMCVDEVSQAKLTNFSLSLQQHLISQGIPVPNWQSAQPPYHASLATTSEDPSSAVADFNANNKLDLSIELFVFYFGTTPYFAGASFCSPSLWVVAVLVLFVMLGVFVV